MTTFVVYREDPSGDLVDVSYFDTHICMIAAIEYDGVFTTRMQGGQRVVDGDGRHVSHVSWGASPCDMEHVEYAVYCGWCGTAMNEEAERTKEKVDERT